MTATSLMYWQEKLGKTQPRSATFLWEITAAKTISPLVPGIPVLSTFDALASQAVIDDFLGTTNEFLLAAFDATAMGTDAFAVIVNMAGQVDKVLSAKFATYSGTAGVTEALNCIKSSSSLTASSLSAEFAKGANGNMAARFVSTGLDALTAGILRVDLSWISK